MHLVVTHKSILRALLCTALGLPSTSFRAFDVNNGGVVTFRCAAAAAEARSGCVPHLRVRVAMHMSITGFAHFCMTLLYTRVGDYGS